MSHSCIICDIVMATTDDYCRGCLFKDVLVMKKKMTDCFICSAIYTDDPTKEVKKSVRPIKLEIHPGNKFKDGGLCEEHNVLVPKDQTKIYIDVLRKYTGSEKK